MPIKEEIKKRAKEARFIAKETYKGLPEAGKKVGGFIGKGIGMAMQGPGKAVGGIAQVINRAADVQLKKYEPKTQEEKRQRIKKMQKIKELEEKFKHLRK